MAQDQAKPGDPDLTQGIAVPAQKENGFGIGSPVKIAREG